jgi:TPP-dependent 2-oxoacid decarboxylase
MVNIVEVSDLISLPTAQNLAMIAEGSAEYKEVHPENELSAITKLISEIARAYAACGHWQYEHLLGSFSSQSMGAETGIHQKAQKLAKIFREVGYKVEIEEKSFDSINKRTKSHMCVITKISILLKW